MNKKTKKVTKPVIDHNSVPVEVELFGRVIETVTDSERLNLIGKYGEARYGANKIVITEKITDKDIPKDEIKLTYLHEMFHFILIFTGYDSILRDTGKINLEQFIELMSAAIYQYQKSAKYKN